MGYILASVGARPVVAEPAARVASGAQPPVFDEAQLRAYRDTLSRDPKNVQAAVGAANLLYDAQRYHEAIGFYQQAIAVDPSDVNISTDLGTALWYGGRPDEALAQYEKSLALNAAHAQTLFNVGIVRSEGKKTLLALSRPGNGFSQQIRRIRMRRAFGR
jgi:tetratricopeptide (TPR) repeat protein